MQVKTLFLGLLTAIIAISANAQTFSVSSDYIETTYNVNDYAGDFIYVRNHSGASLGLSFQTLKNTMTPNGWGMLLCTNKDCYTYVPSSGSMGVIANGDSGYFDLRANLLGKAGTGEIKIKVYQTGNPSNADTITIIYHATNSTGIFANVDDNSVPLSQNYPNPFTKATIIKYHLPTALGTLLITDLSGRLIKTVFLTQVAGEIMLDSELKAGMYLYSLKNEHGNTIATRPMLVH